jgi:hypothetical protein
MEEALNDARTVLAVDVTSTRALACVVGIQWFRVIYGLAPDARAAWQDGAGALPCPSASSCCWTTRWSPDHPRHFRRDQIVYDPWHYLPVLIKKPGALRNGAPGGIEALILCASARRFRNHGRNDWIKNTHYPARQSRPGRHGLPSGVVTHGVVGTRRGAHAGWLSALADAQTGSATGSRETA